MTTPYSTGVKLAFADFGVGLSIPKTPFTVSMKDRSERLPGMGAWAPRDTVERAFAGVDAGLDDQAIQNMEEDKGSVSTPVITAAAAAALAHFGLKLPAVSTGLVGLGGAAIGNAYHNMTSGKRHRTMAQALAGVHNERSRFPVKGQSRTTASENTPLVIQSGGAE